MREREREREREMACYRSFREVQKGKGCIEKHTERERIHREEGDATRDRGT